MRQLETRDFDNNEAWLIFRLDARVADEYLDIYIVMHLPSTFILIHHILEKEMSQQVADELFKKCAAHGRLPSRVLLTSGDPAEPFFKTSAADYSMVLETRPAPYLAGLISPIKKSFGERFPSPSTLGHHDVGASEEDIDSLKHFIPDSYDLCSCASGKKYKFCCKKIIVEVTMAMAAAEEDRDMAEALQWIEQARALVGETAEVLCREAIVYSFFDAKKGRALLEKCLKLHPNHPRAHYIHGIDLKQRGDFHGALTAYQTAMSNYPESDHFHLNETSHNLGGVFLALNDLKGAQSAWEKALLYMPSDEMTQRNLREFIYRDKNQVF